MANYKEKGSVYELVGFLRKWQNDRAQTQLIESYPTAAGKFDGFPHSVPCFSWPPLPRLPPGENEASPAPSETPHRDVE